MSNGDPISEIHLHDDGIEGSQYYQGFSPCRGYEGVSGVGDNPAEAIDDALEMMAQDGVGFLDEANGVLLKQEGLTEWPETPSASEGYLEASREEAGLDSDDDSMDDSFEMDGMDSYYYVGICYIRGTTGIGGRFISPEDDSERGPNRFMDPPSPSQDAENDDEDLPPEEGQMLLPFMEEVNPRPHPQHDRFQEMIRNGTICPKCFTAFANTTSIGIGNRQIKHKICGCDGAEYAPELYPHDTTLIPGSRRLFTFSMDESSSFKDLVNHNGQPVTIIDGPEYEDGTDDSLAFCYKGVFDDGTVADVMEDELGEENI